MSSPDHVAVPASAQPRTLPLLGEHLHRGSILCGEITCFQQSPTQLLFPFLLAKYSPCLAPADPRGEGVEARVGDGLLALLFAREEHHAPGQGSVFADNMRRKIMGV